MQQNVLRLVLLESGDQLCLWLGIVSDFYAEVADVRPVVSHNDNTSHKALRNGPAPRSHEISKGYRALLPSARTFLPLTFSPRSESSSFSSFTCRETEDTEHAWLLRLAGNHKKPSVRRSRSPPRGLITKGLRQIPSHGSGVPTVGPLGPSCRYKLPRRAAQEVVARVPPIRCRITTRPFGLGLRVEGLTDSLFGLCSAALRHLSSS